MQFGRIVGLLPTDNAPGPSGIQTDIIATGGSSGSPIIDLDSGEGTCNCSKLLPAEIFGNAAIRRKDNPEVIDEGIINGMSKIGLVYGRSYNSLERIPEGARSDLEQGVPYRSASNITLYGNQGWEKR